MKIGYTVWTWMLQKDERTGKLSADPNVIRPAYEGALKEISYLGYQTTETFTPIVDAFEGAEDEFVALNKSYGLSFECLYAHLSPNYRDELDSIKRYVEFMKKAGIKYLNLQMPMRDLVNDVKVTDADVDGVADFCNEIGKLCADAGCVLCVHQHLNTYVETAEQFERFAKATDHNVVKFCYDTAHLYFGGIDYVDAVYKYADRVKYIHLKDVDYIEAEDKFSRFRPLGLGLIDFPHFVGALKDVGYDGILCVELDRTKHGNFEGAQYSRNYLRAAFNY